MGEKPIGETSYPESDGTFHIIRGCWASSATNQGNDSFVSAAFSA